jgi:hypothetical protein
MRATISTGFALLVGGVAIVLLSSGLDLELESTALMGVAMGAVVALMPDRTPVTRILAFATGFVIALIGYFVRAALLPDTAGGRAVALALVIALCVAAAAGSFDRLSLWGTLLGAAALAGGYESSYAAAPSEVVDTSLSSATAILLTFAVGFLCASLGGGTTREAADRHRRVPGENNTRAAAVDMNMESAR